MGQRGHLKPLAEEDTADSCEGPGGEGNATNSLGVGSSSLSTDAQATHIYPSSKTRHSTALPGGVGRALKSLEEKMPLGAGGKSNDRLENWGIRIT